MPGTTSTTVVYAYLPFAGESNRSWLRAVLGKGVRFTAVQRENRTVWKIASKYLLPLAAAMAERFNEIEMRFEISKTMRCDTNCQDASPYTVWRCVCACGGEDHGGIGRYSDWYRTGRTTLIRSDTTQVERITIWKGQIRLPEEPVAAAPAPVIARPPAPEPPRSALPPPTVPPRNPAHVPPAPEPPRYEPRTVVPAADRFAHHEPVASIAGPPPVVRPRPVVVEPPRRRGASALITVAAAIAAVGIGVIVMPHHTAAGPTPTSSTIQPTDIQPTETPPEDTQPAELPPPQTQASRQFPPGCYPFQTGC
ncbi:hypothetical protein AB0L82_35500 [Nocardia sp. NPDC052001]|uniref:hypothetical protein n=1 Tax=Nocardia sp. NPDC052001 TaxID=3154853 RepID=UPI0034342830